MSQFQMKNVLLTLLLILLGCQIATASERPSRVVSINLCTDQLLLMLAEPEQIASVSHLALEPNSSYMADKAAKFRINYAKAEELIELKPDLILAGLYNDRSLVLLLKKLGYRVEVFPLSSNLEDIRNNIRVMAELIGRETEGQRLISEMDKRLEQISRSNPTHKPRGAFYQPNGYTSGRNTLQHSALELAGWLNIADEEGVVGYGSLDLERLILAKPEQLFTSSYAPGTQSRGQLILKHPVLKQLTHGREMIEVAYKYWICGGPMITDAVEILHKSLPR
ncbi:MAG: ABC transporter substrate-binding protein [Sedimenticola sp.]|uniref:ABC transporter substrate-binding protein n=1 Tax=Sedimenticola thiotaurini TaxID=1543721 RepID=A0A558CPJ2_9GAMM|nr:ABC transporter substrate-binding protein [Sedimenticola sp.]MCW8920013.1 ABC transporter substrate-binding protein [Sedimenticola sp.]MCW9022712.1 ABC transporter substrate-binding protein [Sedimenticola sp.]TVT50691.1 MAG: ABC transporter substrate-binding protein [Sedimenticola thiotaurini]